ncbi:CRISPR-associated protein Cst1 [Streptomyces aidingensis]|uniref:CRISPR-associated protein Cst1 n=2 Tax=Streptomyces aidingensis TaxID=910347 RepID=A0A1I1UHG3_9ACTN|nr:CRISPR-associated protein Cst1 [Streptomyces aidingensis]
MVAGTAAPLILTSHPLQRAGAWAVAVMASRPSPQEVSTDDLDGVASRLVEDVTAAAVAAKETAAYDWWKVLFALYPNSKATHSKRPRDRAALRESMAELFAADPAGAVTRPCTFCGMPASAVWTKSNLPMFDTNKALNTLPPGVPGWPVCRGCRICAWALPYAAWVTAGSATVLTCERDEAEASFARRNVLRARRVMQLGFDGLPVGARAELVAARALRALPPRLPAGTTLWSFKNDNQEPWLRVTRTRRAVPVFLAAVTGSAELRRGWRLLERSLTYRDRSGQVTVSGPDEAARLLFEAEDGRSRSLLMQLHRLLSSEDRSWRAVDRASLTRLAFTYAKDVLGMTTDLEPVAELIADWIEHGSGSPRGRLAEYRAVALSDYKLGALLLQAQYRLTMDGRRVAAGPQHWKPLIEQRPRGWEQRMLLGATVFRLLQERGVAIAAESAERSEDERDDSLADLLEQPPLGLDEDDEMGPA